MKIFILLNILMSLVFSAVVPNFDTIQPADNTSIIINNRVWYSHAGTSGIYPQVISEAITKLEDSLQCKTGSFCSDNRNRYNIEQNLKDIQKFDSIIFSRICGKYFHMASKTELIESYWMYPRILSRYLAIPNASYNPGYIRIVFKDDISNKFVQMTSNSDYNFRIDYGPNGGTYWSIYGDTACDPSLDTWCLITSTDGSGSGIVRPLVLSEPFSATVCVSDYLVDSSKVIKIIDTMRVIDTIKQLKIDTIRSMKTVTDTIALHTIVHDTIKIDVTSIDTIINTIYKIDTLKFRDTVNSCKIDPTYTYYSLYNSKHIFPTMRGIQLFEPNDNITWKNGSDNKTQNDFTKTVSIKIEANTTLDIAVYIYDNTGVFVNSFEGKINTKSNAVKYLTWGGMTAGGKRVVDGVYVIRVLIRDGNRIANNVYKVGVER